MARTALNAQAATEDGLDLEFTAAPADGHWIDPGEILVVTNGGASPIDVTLQTGATLDGHAVADTVVTIPAGETRYIGNLTRNVYEQPSGAQRGKVLVDFSDVTSVTVAALTQ